MGQLIPCLLLLIVCVLFIILPKSLQTLGLKVSFVLCDNEGQSQLMLLQVNLWHQAWCCACQRACSVTILDDSSFTHLLQMTLALKALPNTSALESLISKSFCLCHMHWSKEVKGWRRGSPKAHASFLSLL